MNETQKSYYKRFSQFAIDCAKLVARLDWRIASNKEWGKQLIRSSGSIGANFIEAVEGSSDPDFIYRYNICRKEANESVHWLYLLKRTNDKKHYLEIDRLIKEAREFVKIFTTSIETKKKNMKKDDK